MVKVFREVKRVLKDDGVVWLNLGDSYISSRALGVSGLVGSLKQKDLVGIPWRVAFALQDDGWYLRQDIIWAKPNPMPEPVKDRCTKSHEHIFLLTKNSKYYFDSEAIKEPSKEGLFRNKRDVWKIQTRPYPEAHFATFPTEIPEICIKAGSKLGDVVLDPFAGAGTTGLVAIRLNRDALLIELNPEYIKLIEKRVHEDAPMLNKVEIQ